MSASSRRDFLKRCAGAAAACAALPAAAQIAPKMEPQPRAGGEDFVLPRARFICDRRVACPWNIYPGGDLNLLKEFSTTVSCRVKLPNGVSNYTPMLGDAAHFGAVVDLDAPERMRGFPLIFMTAEGQLALNANEKAGLKEYIDRGGFVLMDDCVFDRGGDFFYQSAHQLLQELYGPNAVQPIPLDHEVFRNVFDLSKTGLPHAQGQQHGARGLTRNERLAVFLSPSDLHCAWTDQNRLWFPDPNVHTSAIKMGINILTYALSH